MLSECTINISKNVSPVPYTNLLLRWEGKDNFLAYAVVKRITQYLMKHILISPKVQWVTIQVLQSANLRNVIIIYYKTDMTACVKSYQIMKENYDEFLPILQKHLRELLHSIME